MEYNVESMPRDIRRVACAIQAVVTMTQCMFETQRIKKSLWTEAVADAVYTLHQCLTRVLRFVTHEETRIGRILALYTCTCLEDIPLGRGDRLENGGRTT